MMKFVGAVVAVAVVGLVGTGESVVVAVEPSVARAQLTTQVENREPVDQVLVLGSDYEKIYYFTELKNLSGQTVVHRWEFAGQVEAEVSFQVTSDRWRAYSSKTMDASKRGEWTVVVVDQRGWPLKATMFQYLDGETQFYQ